MDYSFWYKIRRPWSHYPFAFILGLLVATFYFYKIVIDPYVGVPRIGRGLSVNSNFATQQFQESVDEYFSLPMLTTEFIAELEMQGFDIDEKNQMARFFKKTIMCKNEWRMIWVAENQTVSSIKALYFLGCGI